MLECESEIPSPGTTTSTAVGKTRSCGRLSRYEILFICISIVNITASVVLSIIRLITVVNDDPSSPDFTFCILLILNACFCAFYAIHGLFREREYELYALIAAVSIIVVYVIINYALSDEENRGPIKLVRMIVAIVLGIIHIVLAGLVAHEFGFLEFRIAGASEVIQHMYRQASFFSSLVKFDLQLSWSFIILALINGSSITTAETVILAIGIPYTFIWLLVGYFAMRKEIHGLSYFFVFTWLAVPAFLLYKVITMYMVIDTTNKDPTGFDPRLPTLTMSVVILVAGAALLFVHIATLIEWIQVHKNFGKQLKQRVFDQEGDLTGLIRGEVPSNL